MSMAVNQPLNLKPGMIIQGKYEILRCLGAGSMGMVYAVKHLDLQGRILALKVLFSDVAKDEVQAARFKNEIVASYDVNHPHVVRAYDFFRENELIAYTMEYVSGGDLADRLSEEELMRIDEILLMLRQMASGVQAIHEAGIIHRDLKPENILISEQGDIKITDFGIARNLKGPRLTDHGGIVGTFAYVSPEYLEHGKVDVRSDIYSLGVLAYEMITGEPPYSAKNVVEEMHLRLTTDPTPPDALRKECPRKLSNAILKALSRDPEQRFASANEFYEVLSDIDKINVTDEFSSPSDEFTNKVDNPLVNPKVLENEVEVLLQGLKDSLEDRSYGLQNFDRTYNDSTDKNHDLLSGYGFINDVNDSASMSHAQIGVSQGSLSVDKIKALEHGLKNRNPFSGKNNFLNLNTGVTSFITLLSGFIIGVLVIRYFMPSMFNEAKDFIYDSFIKLM